MRDKSGFELAISTLVVIILGLLLLVGLVWAVTYGFERFKEEGLDSTEVINAKNLCEIACESGNSLDYCCKDYEISGGDLRCGDRELGVECVLDCEGFVCPSGE